MADEHDSRDSPDDLYLFAQALVRKLLKKKGLTWDRHRVEDAEQDLFLAGWKVWQDEGDIGLADNAQKLSREEDELMAGPLSPALERFREELPRWPANINGRPMARNFPASRPR